MIGTGPVPRTLVNKKRHDPQWWSGSSVGVCRHSLPSEAGTDPLPHFAIWASEAIRVLVLDRQALRAPGLSFDVVRELAAGRVLRLPWS